MGSRNAGEEQRPEVGSYRKEICALEAVQKHSLGVRLPFQMEEVGNRCRTSLPAEVAGWSRRAAATI